MNLKLRTQMPEVQETIKKFEEESEDRVQKEQEEIARNLAEKPWNSNGKGDKEDVDLVQSSPITQSPTKKKTAAKKPKRKKKKKSPVHHKDDEKSKIAAKYNLFNDRGDLVPSRFVDYMTDGLGMKFMSLYLEPKTVRILKNGVYKKDFDETPTKELMNIVGNRDRQPVWNRNIDELIRREHRHDPEEGTFPGLHKDYINCLNGFICLKTGELISHEEFYEQNPDAKSLIQIPVEYHEDADCPEFNSFLMEKMDSNKADVRLIFELFGYAMLQYVPIPVVVEFQGPTHTGKSTTFEVLFALLGKGNYSTVRIHDVDNPNMKFARGPLYGMLANIDADSSEEAIEGGGFIKKISAGDPISVENKYVDERTETLFCTMFYSANYDVRNKDKSDGIYSRMIRIPFKVSHKDNPERNLSDKFKEEKELQGIFRSSIRAVIDVLEKGQFTKSDRVKQELQDFMIKNDPIMDWCDNNLALDQEDYRNNQYVEARYDPQRFHHSYQRFVGQNIDVKTFYKALKQWAKIDKFERGRRYDGTKDGSYIPGLAFKTDQNDDDDILL